MKIIDIKKKLLLHFTDAKVIFQRGIKNDDLITDVHHLDFMIISDSFLNMNTVARNRSVFSILQKEIGEIHAITLKLFTNEEIKKLKNNLL